MGYVYLSVAIVFEVIATTALKSSEGFTKLGPSAVVAVGYAVAFYALSVALKEIPVGVAYAIWSGVGIVLISLLGWLVHRQTLDGPAWIGMALIAIGVMTIQLGSRSLPS